MASSGCRVQILKVLRNKTLNHCRCRDASYIKHTEGAARSVHLIPAASASTSPTTPPRAPIAAHLPSPHDLFHSSNTALNALHLHPVRCRRHSRPPSTLEPLRLRNHHTLPCEWRARKIASGNKLLPPSPPRPR